MHAEPVAAVIVAARDEERRIGTCLEALLQSCPLPLEVVVVDDGSTDSTSEVVRRCAAQDPRVRLLRNEVSRGRGAARNQAVAASTAPVLVVQDADDVSLPWRIPALLALLEQRTADVASGQCLSVDERLGTWRHAAFPVDHDEIVGGLLHGRMTVCHPAAAIRRTAFERVGGYDASFVRAQDLQLCLRLARDGATFAATEEDLILYRHPVLLPWQQWRQTREAERRLMPASPTWWPSLPRPLRYGGATVRRGRTYVRTRGVTVRGASSAETRA